MLSPALLRRIRRIELHTKRLVHNVFAGAYQSAYKGRGLSFAAVRPYEPGDDVRTIDWKVTARTGEPYIKEFIEERELTLMLVVDGSASVLFGTQDQQKRDFAAELGAVLAYAATRNNDKAGMLIFSDRVERYIPAKKGRNHLLNLIRELLTFEPEGMGTDLSLALQTVNRVLKPGAIVFLLSDFMADPETYRRALLLTGKNHDATAVILSDPLEEDIPALGLMSMRDAETGTMQWVDTRSEKWQQQFYEQQKSIRAEREALLHTAGVNRLEIPPDRDYVRALSLFFQERVRQRR